MVKLIITTGDPAGIGQEIVLKALKNNSFDNHTKIIVAGDKSVYKFVEDRLGYDLIEKFYDKDDIGTVLENKEQVSFVQVNDENLNGKVLGVPNRDTAAAALSYLNFSAELLKNNKVEAVVTAPISKEKLWEIGFEYPGHTEFYAHELGAEKFVMLLGGNRLKVTLVTIHIPLKEIWNNLSKEKIKDTVKITNDEFKRSFGINNPRIAIAGLNPHAGEGGKMGAEERDIIIPAIKELKEEGVFAEGPFPPDTLYYWAYQGKYDVVVSMYHDQGLIPLKLVHFDDAVNVTLGLPKVRTSVDHGTAFDIASEFKANYKSMETAINTAIEMVNNRNGK